MSRRPADVGLHNWRRWPQSRWAFHHVRELIPTAGIPRAVQPVQPFVVVPADLNRLRLAGPAGETDLVGLLEASFTDAFVVLAGRELVMEWHAEHMAPGEPHILFSVSKSITGLLAGILADKGMFDPEAAIVAYLPEAASSAYAPCSMRHLLDMTVSLDFEEDYTASAGDYVAYREATGWNPVDQRHPAPDLAQFLLSLRPGDEPHGTVFRYRSPNVDLLGLVLEHVTGESLTGLLSKHLWQPLGARDDAYVTVDRSGLARAAGGMCATANDLVRLGRMILRGGEVEGAAVVSQAWIEDTGTGGDRAAWQKGDFSMLFPQGQYRNLWYQTGDADGSLCAIGIHGQYLYINPARSVVIAKQSSVPDPLNDTIEAAVLAAFSRIAAAL